MENEKPQDTSPDEAMANLAFATKLQESLLQQGNQGQTTTTEGENGAEMPLNGTETPQVEETPVMEENTPETTTEAEKPEEEAVDPMVEMGEKMEEIKSELKDTIKEEMKGFKKIISDAIQE